MRTIWTGIAAGALVMGFAVASGAPAHAAMDPNLGSIVLTDNHAASTTGATVTARLSQLQYADIAFDIGFEGFTARHRFAYATGACPQNLILVQSPARVFKCGWEQKGSTALLSLALRGTFDTGTISVRFADGAMTTPAAAGRYSVTLSGWSFDDVTGVVRITPACVDTSPLAGQAVSRGDVVC